MNWKAFIIACSSAFATLFPGNGITCGPTEDPHDYFTSFFSNRTGTGPEYEPFYYTSLLKFYDEDNWWSGPGDSLASVDPAIAEEWKVYGKSSSLDDAIQLVYFSKAEALQTLAENIRTGNPLPQHWQKNTVAQHFSRAKKEDAIRYLQFVKKTAEISSASDWEAKTKDSLEINRFIAEASDAYTRTTDPFLKNKWAFQRCKLAFYNNRHEDCIRWYDEYFPSNPPSAVANLALSYKAGSLFRSHKFAEAAYEYSKAFTLSDRNKKKNFTGFLWASDFCNQDLVESYTAQCKTIEERATMTAMFGMYGTDYRLHILEAVYALLPSSPLLPLLATREIHKLEEQFFTPRLAEEKGGKPLYVSYTLRDDSTTIQNHDGGLDQVKKTAAFFERLAQDKRVKQQGLYAAGAAYLHFMAKDYADAKAILAKAAAGNEKIRTQLQLITLLVAANEDKTLTKEREAQLLPSFQWLVQKARDDRDYEIFCRNFFSQVLAQRYEQQGDTARAALAYGLSDLTFLVKRRNNDYNYSSPTAIWYARDEMSTESLLQLYNLMTVPKTATEKFLAQHASIRRDDVIDVIGTSHLRDRDYTKAIEWLGKAGKAQPLVEERYDYKTDKTDTVNVDPFFDYLNDWQRFNKSVPVPYTKLTLAKKLQELETKIKLVAKGTDPSRLYYQYASALYNMSYYGNSWQAVAFYRSGGDWNHGNYGLPWQKDYYGVHTAKNWYQKAYETATNKEFKAACLFMVAKCAQRQVVFPSYGDYPTYEGYERAEAAAQRQFQYNPLFATFKKSFGTTKFYQYTYSRCSYLRDYVKKEQASGRAR